MDSRVDVVIPVFNAENHILQTLQELTGSRIPGEIICVDDASTDQTAQILESCKDKITYLINTENSGQHASTRLGLAQTQSEWVLTIDDDLPIAPVEIERFIREGISKNCPLCYASYKNHRSWVRKTGSAITNRILLKRFGIKGQGSSTRLIHRSVIDKIRAVETAAKFLDADLLHNATDVSFVKVTARKTANTSRYGFVGLVRKFTHMFFGS